MKIKKMMGLSLMATFLTSAAVAEENSSLNPILLPAAALTAVGVDSVYKNYRTYSPAFNAEEARVNKALSGPARIADVDLNRLVGRSVVSEMNGKVTIDLITTLEEAREFDRQRAFRVATHPNELKIGLFRKPGNIAAGLLLVAGGLVVLIPAAVDELNSDEDLHLETVTVGQ